MLRCCSVIACGLMPPAESQRKSKRLKVVASTKATKSNQTRDATSSTNTPVRLTRSSAKTSLGKQDDQASPSSVGNVSTFASPSSTQIRQSSRNIVSQLMPARVLDFGTPFDSQAASTCTDTLTIATIPVGGQDKVANEAPARHPVLESSLGSLRGALTMQSWNTALDPSVADLVHDLALPGLDIRAHSGLMCTVLGLDLRLLSTMPLNELTLELCFLRRDRDRYAKLSTTNWREEAKWSIVSAQGDIYQAFVDVHTTGGYGAMTSTVLSERDLYYNALHTSIEALSNDSEDWTKIVQCFVQTDRFNFEVLGIFVVQRHPEITRFLSAKKSATSLFFHGTCFQNVLSIFRQGLLLDNPGTGKNGATHGKGLYFADTAGRSASYCLKDRALAISKSNGRQFAEGYMFLAELCLGNTMKSSAAGASTSTRTITSHDINLTRATRLRDNSALPQGQGQIVVIKDESRIKLRYLIKFRQYC